MPDIVNVFVNGSVTGEVPCTCNVIQAHYLPLFLRFINVIQFLPSINVCVEVFKNEAPSQKITVGVLYYSGCPMEYHSDFLLNNSPAYVYYKNTSTDSNTKWTQTAKYTCLQALQDEQWDVIVMQQMSRHAGLADLYNGDFSAVRDYLMNNVDYTPKLGFHVPWVTPDSYSDFFDERVAPSSQS